MTASSFAVPTDPSVRVAAAITIGAVLFLILVGRVFRDVNPG